MFYINEETNQYPIEEGAIKALFPNASFGEPFNPPEPYAVVQNSVQPEFDRTVESIQELPPIKLNGQWVRAWAVAPLTPEAQEIVRNEAARLVRLQRNKNLQDCDWTQLADAPVDKTAWATYRQALRDVSEQEVFPFNVVWPVQPE